MVSYKTYWAEYLHQCRDLNNLDPEWRQVDMDDLTDSDILEFFRLNCTFSININATDDKTVGWIKRHKDKILPIDHGK